LDDSRPYNSDPLRDVINTAYSEGLAVSLVLVENQTSQVVDQLPTAQAGASLVIPWTPWNQPVFQERLKDSYHILQEYFTKRQE